MDIFSLKKLEKFYHKTLYLDQSQKTPSQKFCISSFQLFFLQEESWRNDMDNMLIDKFPIALFTDDFFWSVWSIRRNHYFLTLRADSLMEFSRISQRHTFLMTLVRMLCWEREIVLDVKCELLFYYFKRFFGYFTLEDSREELIDIFLSWLVSDIFFIILIDRERSVVGSYIGIFIFSIVPFPSLFFCLIL